MLVLFPLVLSCTKGNEPGSSVPPPPPVVNPGGGEEPGQTHPWDANRGKVVRPQTGNGWTVTTIEDGVDYYAFEGKESITGTNQHIYVTDIDLAKPYSVKLGYYNPSTTASKVFAATNAVACINGGYEKTALYLKVNGTTLSTITALSSGGGCTCGSTCTSTQTTCSTRHIQGTHLTMRHTILNHTRQTDVTITTITAITTILTCCSVLSPLALPAIIRQRTMSYRPQLAKWIP